MWMLYYNWYIGELVALYCGIVVEHIVQVISNYFIHAFKHSYLKLPHLNKTQ